MMKVLNRSLNAKTSADRAMKSEMGNIIAAIWVKGRLPAFGSRIFMPNQVARKERGRKIIVITVKRRIMRP